MNKLTLPVNCMLCSVTHLLSKCSSIHQPIVLLFVKILFISAKYFFISHLQQTVAFKIIKRNGNFLSNLYFLLVVVHTMCRPLQWSHDIISRDIETRVSGVTTHNMHVWKSNLASKKIGRTTNLAFQLYSVHCFGFTFWCRLYVG